MVNEYQLLLISILTSLFIYEYISLCLKQQMFEGLLGIPNRQVSMMLQGTVKDASYGLPTQYSCSGKSHGQRSLLGHSPWGWKESGMT